MIYLIDDDRSVRQSVSRLLRSAGFDVEALPSAAEFLQLKKLRGRSCLILDYQLPGLNGLELQKILRQADRRIPIVFISGNGTIPSSVQAMKEGAVDFLQKPFDEHALLDAVKRAFDKERLDRRNHGDTRIAQTRLKRLTPREKEVLQCVVAGQLNKQVARRLGISEKTVKVHRGRVMEKMGAESIVDLVHSARNAGLPLAPKLPS